MDKFFAAILPAIEHIHLLGYAAAFLVALLETVIVVGLFLPGSTLLLLLGALAAHGALDFADLLGFAVAGAVAGDNVFAVLMDAARVCSLGQLTEAFFEVGGAYRRNV